MPTTRTLKSAVLSFTLMTAPIPAQADSVVTAFPLSVFDAERDCNDHYWGSLQGCSSTPVTILLGATTSEMEPYSTSGLFSSIRYKTTISYDFSCEEAIIPDASLMSSEPTERLILSLNPPGSVQRLSFVRPQTATVVTAAFAITPYDTVRAPCRLTVLASHVVPDVGLLGEVAKLLVNDLRDQDQLLRSIENATIPSERARFLISLPSELDFIVQDYQNEVEALEAEVEFIESKPRNEWSDYEKARHELLTAVNGLIFETITNIHNVNTLKDTIETNLPTYEACADLPMACTSAIAQVYDLASKSFRRKIDLVTMIINYLDEESLRIARGTSEAPLDIRTIRQRLAMNLDGLSNRTPLTGDRS